MGGPEHTPVVAVFTRGAVSGEYGTGVDPRVSLGGPSDQRKECPSPATCESGDVPRVSVRTHFHGNPPPPPHIANPGSTCPGTLGRTQEPPTHSRSNGSALKRGTRPPCRVRGGRNPKTRIETPRPQQTSCFGNSRRSHKIVNSMVYLTVLVYPTVIIRQ